MPGDGLASASGVVAGGIIRSGDGEP